jgi:hypothetical protein
MKIQEAWDLLEGTIKGKSVWKQTPSRKGFACDHGGATFEILQEGEYLYKLTKFDLANNPIDSLQNPEPLPSELTVRGHHCDKYGNVLDEVDVPPLSADSPQAYILIRLYGAARESASIGGRSRS